MDNFKIIVKDTAKNEERIFVITDEQKANRKLNDIADYFDVNEIEYTSEILDVKQISKGNLFIIGFEYSSIH